QIPRHGIDVVGQVLPGTGYALHLRLAAQLAVGADLARHARHLRCKRVELIHHGVDGVLQLQDLALDVHGDLFREVPAGDGGGHVGDVAHLGGQVAGHGIDVVGQVLPGTGYALHLRLAAQLAVGADLARHARHLRCKRVELIHHGVDGVLQLQDLALDVDGDLFREVPAGDGGGHVGDAAHLGRPVVSHHVDVVGEVLPRAGYAAYLGLATQFPFGAHLARHTCHF